MDVSLLSRFFIVALFSLNTASASEWKIDLRSQFREEITEQSGLNCHIYTATALLEARCYRITGKKLDLSESFVLYQHYLDELKKGQKLTLEDLFAEGEHATTAGRFDAGSTKEDLGRVLETGMCEESAFPDMQSFENQLRFFRATALAMHFGPDVLTQMFQQELVKMKTPSAQSAPLSGVLGDCFAKRPTPQSEPFSEERARSLLDRGVPVVCSAGAFLGESGMIDLRGKTNGHATLLIGYKDSPMTRWTHASRTIWLTRDPNYSEPVMSRGNCKVITWFD